MSSAIREGVHGPVGLLVFALLGTLTTVLLVLDDACIGLLRGDLQLKRNAVFAVSKLALLPVLIWAWSSPSGIELVVAWLAGLAISSMTLGLQLRKLTRGQSSRLEFRRLLAKRHLMVGHHWLNLSIQAPRLLLPVLVVLIIGPRANAAFTAAFLVVSFVNVIPSQLSTVLFALAPGDEAALRHQVRKTMRICRLLSIVSAIFFFIFAGDILRVFGHDYVASDHGVDHHRSDHVPAVPQGPLCGDRPRAGSHATSRISDHCRRLPGSGVGGRGCARAMDSPDSRSAICVATLTETVSFLANRLRRAPGRARSAPPRRHHRRSAKRPGRACRAEQRDRRQKEQRVVRKRTATIRQPSWWSSGCQRVETLAIGPDSLT